MWDFLLLILAAGKYHGSPQVHNGSLIRAPERQASSQDYQPAELGQAWAPGQVEQAATVMHTGRVLRGTFTWLTAGRVDYRTTGILPTAPPEITPPPSTPLQRLNIPNNYQTHFLCTAEFCLLPSDRQRVSVSALGRRLPHGRQEMILSLNQKKTTGIPISDPGEGW